MLITRQLNIKYATWHHLTGMVYRPCISLALSTDDGLRMNSPSESATKYVRPNYLRGVFGSTLQTITLTIDKASTLSLDKKEAG